MAAMLKENKITNKRKANEILLRLKFHQHGRRDVTWHGSVVYMSPKKKTLSGILDLNQSLGIQKTKVLTKTGMIRST